MKNVTLTHDQAKQELEAIDGKMTSHPIHRSGRDPEKVARYRTRISEIVGSSKAGTIDGDLADFHRELKAG